MLLNNIKKLSDVERYGLSIEGVYKYKYEHLLFSLRLKPGISSLTVIFSGVDQKPSRCSMSYYGLREELSTNVLHIKDNFGAHGCYFARVAGDSWIQEAVKALITHVVNILGVSKDQLNLIGTSKGGTEAILSGFNLGFGNVIAGEPQIRLGNYLMARGWEDSEVFKSIIYSICGSVRQENKEILNDIFVDRMCELADHFYGKLTLLHGDTGYYPVHIEPLVTALDRFDVKCDVISYDTKNHNDIIPVFLNYIEEQGL